MIISHRGKNIHGLPENSFEAFDLAFASGAGAIECDLQMTRDQQIIVNHGYYIRAQNKKVRIASKHLSHIYDFASNTEYTVITLQSLFDYIEKQKKPFFLEVKSRSPQMIESIVAEIARRNLWDIIHIIGFSVLITSALAAQAAYPKLKVVQIVNVPMLARWKKPTAGYGVFLGWIDGFMQSERFFRLTLSPTRLHHIKTLYESLGFHVFAGVINRADGLDLFMQAGICDVVTDDVSFARRYFKDKKFGKSITV